RRPADNRRSNPSTAEAARSCGLTEAAYAGVFANGALPLFTMLISLMVLGERPKAIQIFGSMVIILGGTLVAWRGLDAGGPNVALGIALFLGASALIASYIWLLKHYSVTPRQALAIVNVPNTVIYLPIWLLFLPTNLTGVPIETVALQAAFQGLGPGFLAVMIFAIMAYHLGANATAGVSASVPAVAALLAVPVLGEVPTLVEWTGIAIVSAGLAIMLRAR
ncbi:MAG: DMT family transporter, partial [Pseudomonadota bacterium]